MNIPLRSPIIALAAGLVLSLGAALPACAASCANPNGAGVERACAKAAQGATALRRFVERTQAIYGLSFYDFRGEAVVEASEQREALRSAYADLRALGNK
jgi:hypothetical protein